MKNFKLFVPVALVVIFTAFACNKEKDTIAKIKIVDASGTVVGGADVTLYPNGTLDTLNNYWDFCFGASGNGVSTTTDASGEASFNFTDCYKQGQAGFAVLDITASKGTMLGTGIIKIVEEETSEETVTIQ